MRRRDLLTGTSHTVRQYVLSGVLFGAIFPLMAWGIDYVRLDPGLSWGLILWIHQQDPTAFVVDLAPFVLGGTAFILARERLALEHALDIEHHAASRDTLTGALNHGAITGVLRQAVEENRPCSVAMVDIDDLKFINDTYGHQVGDELIIAAARVLERDGAIVGRYGGDEFLSVLVPGDVTSAGRYRHAVLADLAAVAVPEPTTGRSVPLKLSIGMVTYPTEASRIEDLIRIADSGMYDMRRTRPVHPDSLTARTKLEDPITRIIRDVVPLLTSPGDLQEKLHSVAARIRDAVGYDGVDFQLSEAALLGEAVHSTVSGASKEMIDDWKQEATRNEDHGLDAVLASTRRPVILGDLSTDQRISQAQRELLSASGLVTGMVAPMLWRDEVIGTLGVASRRSGAFGPRDADLVMTIATQVAALVHITQMVDELAASAERLRQSQADAMMLLAASAEAHDEVTGRHLERVRQVSEALANEMGYKEEDAREVGLAAMLHDVGKLRVPESILKSPGSLDEHQWRVMREHAVWGSAFLANRPGFELASIVAGAHHERWDGQGYPLGIAGDAIPEQATIVTVADSFDAMTSDRPYREGRSPAEVLTEIADGAGKQFNPDVVDALLRLHRRGLLCEPAAAETEARRAA